MKKVIRLTESDLIRIIKKTIKEMDEDMTETDRKTMSMFGHCLGRTEKPCRYTVEDWEYEILDNDFDIDEKLKRIGLKLQRGSGPDYEYIIRDNEIYRQIFNLD